jgi:preprotein translocase subunit SecA
MLPDLTTALHEIDTGPETDARKRLEAKTKLQQEFETKAQRIHAISQLLKAYCLYQKDVQYVVQDNKVIIVDENTGRLMTGPPLERRPAPGRRSQGRRGNRARDPDAGDHHHPELFPPLPQAGRHDRHGGNRGGEFFDIYKLGVLVIPTNRRWRARTPTIRSIRPGARNSTPSSRKSRRSTPRPADPRRHHLGRGQRNAVAHAEAEGIIHSVLNAKYHQQEAEIVSRAGQRGAVTIATNMAGRGTDIKLGEGVPDAGGLHVIGTERHEARRIDRQLRGRCARQGDPGSSHFFISLEDDLMRLFGSDRIVKYMEKMGLEEGQELEHPAAQPLHRQAQKRVEQHNFQIRKRTLEYDDVMNKQREVIYGFRNEIINADDVRDRLMDIMEEVVIQKVEQFTTRPSRATNGKCAALADWVNLNFPLGMPEGKSSRPPNPARKSRWPARSSTA